MVPASLPSEPKHVHMVVYADRLALLSVHNECGVLAIVILDPQ